MNVAQLIEHLKAYEPWLEVVVADDNQVGFSSVHPPQRIALLAGKDVPGHSQYIDSLVASSLDLTGELTEALFLRSTRDV